MQGIETTPLSRSNHLMEIRLFPSSYDYNNNFSKTRTEIMIDQITRLNKITYCVNYLTLSFPQLCMPQFFLIYFISYKFSKFS